MTRLENWTLMARTDIYGNQYKKLIGNVYGHPRANEETGELCDGNNIITSRIIKLDLDSGIAITKTGTTYYLGSKNTVNNI